MRETTMKPDFSGSGIDQHIALLLENFTLDAQTFIDFYRERNIAISYVNLVKTLTNYYAPMVETLAREMCVNGVLVEGGDTPDGVPPKRFFGSVINAIIAFNEKTHAAGIILSVASESIAQAIAEGDLPVTPCHTPNCKVCASHISVVLGVKQGIDEQYDKYFAIPMGSWRVANQTQSGGILLC